MSGIDISHLSESEEVELLELLEAESVSRSPFRDAWDFCKSAVWTIDEARGEVRPFPCGERYSYLREMTYERERHPIFAVEKSRRMFMTWWMLSLYLYDVLTQKNHANFVGSRKMESSAYLLGPSRMLGIWERIPAEVWPTKPELKPVGKLEAGYSRLECIQTGSYVQAIASGADQLRQYTATNVLCDEFAFWERQRESWGALKPTVEGGGHIDIVSTPELGSFMQDLIYDS